MFDVYHARSLLTFVVLLFALSATTREDYPPPSEDPTGYYDKTVQFLDEDPTKFGSRFINSRSSITNFDHHHDKKNKKGNRGLEKGAHKAWDAPNQQWFLVDGPSTSIHASKCVTIPANMTLCKDVGYSKMLLPNLLGHDTLREAVQQSASWVRVKKPFCHKDIQKFLCSLFAPVCLDSRGVRPCRSMCEAVRDACEPSMLTYGFQWPEMLRCNQFPESDQLCIGNENDKVCDACKSVTTFEQSLHLYCRADFVLKVVVDESVVNGENLKVTTINEKTQVLKFVPKNTWTHRRRLRGQALYVRGGSGCDCPHLETINGFRDNSTLLLMGKFVTAEGEAEVKDEVIGDVAGNSDAKFGRSSRERLLASSVISMSKGVRKMMKAVADAGPSGLEDLCKNKSKFLSEVKGNVKDKNSFKDRTDKSNRTKDSMKVQKKSRKHNGNVNNNNNNDNNNNRRTRKKLKSDDLRRTDKKRRRGDVEM